MFLYFSAEDIIMTKSVKPRTSPGFTIAEVLVTILILLMVSTVVAAGIPAAKRAYEKIVLSANAEVLLSTSVASLRDNLATAEDVAAQDGAITFYSGDGGINKKIYPDAENGGVIMLQEYIGYDQNVQDVTRQLVTDAASTRDLYVTYEGVSCEGQIVTIQGLSVYRKSQAGTGAAPLTSIDTLYIRVIGNAEKENG